MLLNLCHNISQIGHCVNEIRKQRYVYGTRLEGIVEFDLYSKPESDKTRLEVGGIVQGLYDPGHDQYGSEAVFVPKVPGVTSEEDDGCLIFFVHDEKSGKWAMLVIEAKIVSPDPVAVVDLPGGVPSGFHAIFVTEE